MLRGSVRQRLVLWNLGVIGLVVLLVIGVALGLERRAIDRTLDRELSDGASRTAARLTHFAHEAEEHEEDEVIPGEGRELLVLARLAGASRTFTNRKHATAGLPDEPGFARALGGESVTGTFEAGGVTLRVLTVPVRHDGRVIGAVQVARSTGESERALARATLVLAGTGVLGLLLAVPLGLFLAGRAMRPITDALDRQRRFIADASHELRTPVAVLRARADVLARDGATAEDFVRMRRDAEELSSLLAELLDLARLDAGQIELRREPIPLGDVLEELCEQVTPLAAERGVVVRGQAAPVFARADLGRVRQVLRALLDNAVRHARSTVRVEASTDGRHAILRVIDDGPGLSAADLPRVFERFYRADEARTRARGGAGLGLAIAHELVAGMGGELTVESVPDQGATFTIALPPA